MPQVASHNMRYCAEHLDYQLGATGHAKVAVYLAYVCGWSFFIGLNRLMVALGALCVDYTGKARVQEDQKRSHAEHTNALPLQQDVSPETNQVTPIAEGVPSAIESGERVRTFENGIQMCEQGISSHWQQVARAIVELTVIGGWIYAVIDAVRHYRSEEGNSVDALDSGRYNGMWNRITSDYEDRQYVPQEMGSSLNTEVESVDRQQLQDDREAWYAEQRDLDILTRLEANPLDWYIPAVREIVVRRVNADLGRWIPPSADAIPVLERRGFQESTAGNRLQWIDTRIPVYNGLAQENDD